MVDEETQEQLDDLRRERVAHARRLSKLREQRAMFGSLAVPPHISTDIDETVLAITQIDEQIGKLKARAWRVEQQEKLVANVDPEQALHQLLAFVFTKWESQDAHAAELAQRDERRRATRQHLQDTFYVVIFIGVALLVWKVYHP